MRIRKFQSAHQERAAKADKQRRAGIEERSHPIERRRFYLDVVAIGVAAAAAIFLLMQQNTMQGQLDEMRAEQRPWVFVSSITAATDLTWDKDGGYMEFNIFLKNSGHIPGTEVQIHYTTFPASLGVDPLEAQKAACAYRPEEPPGDAVFPGEDAKRGKALLLARQNMPQNSSEALRPVIVGCVSYRLPAVTGTHQTSFFFFLVRGDRQPIAADIAVAKDHLDFLPSQYGRRAT